MAGRWFEEFTVGQSFDHEIRRTVTESDNIWFSTATCNPAAVHIDYEYCKGTEFGKPLVNSIFTLGLVIGLAVQETTLGTTVANLGMWEYPIARAYADARVVKIAGGSIEVMKHIIGRKLFADLRDVGDRATAIAGINPV